jgi:hypothetical protein
MVSSKDTTSKVHSRMQHLMDTKYLNTYTPFYVVKREGYVTIAGEGTHVRSATELLIQPLQQ